MSLNTFHSVCVCLHVHIHDEKICQLSLCINHADSILECKVYVNYCCHHNISPGGDKVCDRREVLIWGQEMTFTRLSWYVIYIASERVTCYNNTLPWCKNGLLSDDLQCTCIHEFQHLQQKKWWFLEIKSYLRGNHF